MIKIEEEEKEKEEPEYRDIINTQPKSALATEIKIKIKRTTKYLEYTAILNVRIFASKFGLVDEVFPYFLIT